jgi:hypothetical protein
MFGCCWQMPYDTPCTVAHQMKMLFDAGFKEVKEAWRRGITVVLTTAK